MHVSNTDIFELVIKSLHLHVTSVQSLTPSLNFYATILQDLGPELQCLLRVKEDLSNTIENLCTRTAQSSRGGHSRRVEKIACLCAPCCLKR